MYDTYLLPSVQYTLHRVSWELAGGVHQGRVGLKPNFNCKRWRMLEAALVFGICTIEQFNWKTWHCSTCICPNWRMYFSKLAKVFVQIYKGICLNGNVFIKMVNVFVQKAKCICPMVQTALAAGAFARLSFSTGRNGIARRNSKCRMTMSVK